MRLKIFTESEQGPPRDEPCPPGGSLFDPRGQALVEADHGGPVRSVPERAGTALKCSALRSEVAETQRTGLSRSTLRRGGTGVAVEHVPR